jgi:glycosyltransferase involved in cell wall biosynthesis
MRVLLSAYSCAPGYGSEVGNGWNWSTALADAGHEVTVLTLPDLREEIDVAVAERTGARLRIVYVTTPRAGQVVRGQIGVYVKYLAWQRAAFQAARRLVLAEPFDVVHHLTWGSLHLGTRLGRLPIPLVFGPVGGGQVAPVSLREFYAGSWRMEALRTIVTQKLTLPFAKEAVRTASAVLVNNPETGRLVHRLGGDDPHYFSELGLFPHEIAEGPASGPHGSFQLLWVGRLMPWKGLPLALQAVAEASRSVPLRLRVLGSGPQSELLEEWVDELGIADIVERKGHVPLDSVRASYRNSDALLFTSLRDSTGAQLLEAMAAGLPVITLDHSGAAVLIDRTRGLLVEPGAAADTVSGLAAAIVQLATDRELRVRLAAGGLRYARTQTWSQKAAQMTEIYGSVISDRR